MCNENNLMKTPLCPQERFSYYKKYHRLVLCAKKDWGTCNNYLLSLLYTCYYFIPHYKPPKYLSFTVYNENLTQVCLSIPSAPRWVRHSYLLKNL